MRPTTWATTRKCTKCVHALFDLVRTQVQNHIILLTLELFKRMWCAGEIATVVLLEQRNGQSH